MLEWISGDGKRILLARALRSFGYGFISVIIGIYLTSLGLNPAIVGFLIGIAIIGGAMFTLLTGRYTSTYGIRKMLLFSFFLRILGMLAFLATDNLIVLAAASFVGFIGSSGREVGPFLSLEQAYLPGTVSEGDRTKAFSYWNITGSLAVSFGALFGAVPVLLQNIGYEKITSMKMMLALYLLLNFSALLLYLNIRELQIMPRAEALSRKSRNIVTKLSLLFSLDSFGGGMIITSVVSLWFYLRYGVQLTELSQLFFAAGILETISYYISGRLAKKIGLINTMVFTHLPSNILLMIIPFIPNFTLAAFLYVFRQLLSEMDIPARQSYVVAVVEENERAVVSSVTNVAKITASSIGAAFSGLFISAPIPLLTLAGVIKASYDTMLFFSFRNIKPPEEH